MDVEDDTADNLSESGCEDDDNHPEEIKALKARRRYFRVSCNRRLRYLRAPQTRALDDHDLHVRRGTSLFVLGCSSCQDIPSLSWILTHFFLLWLWSAILSRVFAGQLSFPFLLSWSLMDSLRTRYGEATKAAITFVVGHVHSRADSLKVQTSRGNYLSSLTIRSELVDFDPDSWESNMDDLIQKAAIWQDGR
ncbi:hypothetical protein BJY52DRAFT_637671 [Lactarius psammicola]|nr:hypothetical protein BJY52DRAFT_637671 [Lactarius psammicola]